MNGKRTKITLTIDEELIKEMKIYAITFGFSVSELTEKYWRHFLQKEEAKTV